MRTSMSLAGMWILVVGSFHLEWRTQKLCDDGE
jgi:hypothetical protein